MRLIDIVIKLQGDSIYKSKELDYAAVIQARERARYIAKGHISRPWLGDEVIEKTIYWLAHPERKKHAKEEA